MRHRREVAYFMLNKEKRREYNKKYYLKHREHILLRIGSKPSFVRIRKLPKTKEEKQITRKGSNTRRRSLLRNKCFEHYGYTCKCCGESKKEFLCLDHINGGGNKHRKEEKIRDLSHWAVKNGFPSIFQILCHNCNMAKSLYGSCPHAKIRSSN